MSQSAMKRPASPALRRAFETVGEPEAEFGPGTLRPVGLVLGGVLMTVGGMISLVGVLLQWRHGGLEFRVVAAGLSATVVACMGVVTALRGQAFARRRWFVCAGGVVRQVGSNAEACPWRGLRSVSQAKGRPVYRLDRKEGEPWEVSPEQTPAVVELGRMLRLKAEAHHVAWAVVE